MKKTYKLLTSPDHCAYPHEQVRLVTNSEATGDAIVNALEWLKSEIAEDQNATAFIYFSGHGWQDETNDEYFLIPHDFSFRSPYRSAIRAADFARQVLDVKAPRVLVVLDCCHAAGMDVKGFSPEIVQKREQFQTKAFPHEFDGVNNLPKGLYTEKSIDELMKGNGRAVLNSSTNEEKSWVRQDGTMSIFTYHLIEALTGHAPHADEDSTVLVTDVMSWVQRRVAESAMTEHGQQQNPTMRFEGGHFPIAMLAGGKGVALSKGEIPIDPLTISAQTPPNQIDGTNQSGGVNIQANGPVSVNGSVVGRDQIANHNLQTHINGDQINVGTISNSQGVAIGRGSRAKVAIKNGQRSELDQLVSELEGVLNKVGNAKQSEVLDVHDELEDLKIKINTDPPNPRRVKKSTDRLNEAAQKLTQSAPEVTLLVKKIVRLPPLKSIIEEKPEPPANFCCAFIRETRRVDLAMPQITTVNETTELRALIAVPSSEGLRKFLADNTDSGAVVDKTDQVDEAEVNVEYTENCNSVRLYMRLEPEPDDFTISKPVRKVTLHAEIDSNQLTFLLTPQRELSVAYVPVELYFDEACTQHLGSAGTVTTTVIGKEPTDFQVLANSNGLSNGAPNPPASPHAYVIHTKTLVIQNGDVTNIGDNNSIKGTGIGRDANGQVTKHN